MPPAIRLRSNDTILFIGDSITDADRHKRGYASLGLGYVHFVGNLLLAKYPRLDLRLVNRGVSGDTVRDMAYPFVWAHAWIAQQWLEATGL